MNSNVKCHQSVSKYCYASACATNLVSWPCFVFLCRLFVLFLSSIILVVRQFCISLLILCFISFEFYFDRQPSGSLMLQLPCNRTSSAGPREVATFMPHSYLPVFVILKWFLVFGVLYLVFGVLYLVPGVLYYLVFE